MGIRGLLKLLAGEQNIETKEYLSPGSTLLVDGDSFVFHLRSAELTKYFNVSLNHEYRGDYKELDMLVRLEILRLKESLGFNLIFYFDGSDSYLKHETKEARMQSIIEQWGNLYDITQGQVKRDFKEDELPMAPMCKKQVIDSLKGLKVKVINCDGEADQTIALECCRRLQLNEQCFCLSKDSDFLAMEGSKFINMDDLLPSRIKRSKNDNKNPLSVPVWTRRHISTALGMSEDIFVEFCIALGNDYTKGFERSQLTWPQSLPTGSGSAAVRSLLKIFEDADPSSRLSSDDATLRTAIEYSRSLYRLEPLTPFQTAENKTPSVMDEVAMLDSTIALTKQQKNSIRDFACTNNVQKFTTDVGGDAAFGTINYLNEQVSKQEELRRNGGIGKGNSKKQENGLFPFFSDSHIVSLLYMLRHLRGQLDHNERGQAMIPEGEPSLEWDDICAAQVFQLVLKEMEKSMKAKKKVLKHVREEQPKTCFDGKKFLQFMRMERDFMKCQKKPRMTEKERNEPKKDKKKSVSMDHSETSEHSSKPIKSDGVQLPIDAHRDAILNKIDSDRVTIIHGETGCGKSSRIPIFLLEEAKRTRQRVKMAVTQPRRIAAYNLMKRLKQTYGDEIGLRMGHGIKEETKNTKVFFVTAGYLVQLMTHHPEQFADHTHLIIDEVHERSLDGDLVCLLARRLLRRYSHLRLVLMSATVHTALYKEYFLDPYQDANFVSNYDDYGDLECLSVGARRFPLEIFHLEDLLEDSRAPAKLKKSYKKIIESCDKAKNVDEPVQLIVVQEQYAIVPSLIKVKCQLGTAVLVFVSGIHDIVEILSSFEGLDNYELVAIHSDIPFEDQQNAFNPTAPDQVKVIIATNAAESSLTLPDVDLVICLGTHKAIQYQQNKDNRSRLVNTWISKASATQRAGRTGRVRPGTVIRLYPKALYEQFHDHEEAEVHRQPLHELILRLKVTFEDSPDYEGAKPILEELLEPPEDYKVDDSLQFLYDAQTLMTADDHAKLTTIGRFAGTLPVDLCMSRMILFGITLGIGPESVVLASALSQPKSVFRTAFPIVHSDPDEYNGIVRQTFKGKWKFDQGTYSEPIMMLNLFLVWTNSTDDQQHRLCVKYGVVKQRMKQFVAYTHNLLRTVNKSIPTSYGSGFEEMNFEGMRFGGKGSEAVKSGKGSSEVYQKRVEEKLTLIRIILTWACSGNIIRLKAPSDLQTAEKVTLDVKGNVMLGDKRRLEYFPEEYHCESEMKERCCYDAFFMAPQIRGRSFSFLLQMLLDVTPYKARVAWIHHDQKPSQQAVQEEQHLGFSYQVWGDLIYEGEFVAFAFMSSAVGKSNAFDDELVKSVVSCFDRGRLVEVFREVVDDGKFSIRTFLLPLPKKKELRVLKDIHSMLELSISLYIPPVGNAKLVTSNFQIEQDILVKIFFSDVGLVNSVKQQESSKKGKKNNSESAVHIAKQVQGRRQVLVFKAESSTAELEDALAAMNVSDEKKKGKKDPFLLTAKPKAPLLVDQPSGFRLLKLYAAGYKDRKFYINVEAGEMEEQKKSSGKLVPGSAEWQKAKDLEEHKELIMKNGSSVTKEAMDLGISLPAWNILVERNENPGWVSTVVSKSSHLAASTYCGPQILFGIAYNTLSHMATGGRETIFCDGVTILPPGLRWIALVLLCSGFENVQSLDAGIPAQQKALLEDLPAEEVEQAYDIFSSYEELKYEAVGRNDDLIKRLLQLFSVESE